MRRTDREITDKAEIAAILAKGDVCHLALVDGHLPYIVALNYGCVWEDGLPVLYFHCALAGKKLDVLRANSAGCFMVDIDHVLTGGEKDCDWGMSYKSVVGFGFVAIVGEGPERKKGLDSLMNHYTGRSEFSYDEKVFAMTSMLKMTVTEISGKRKN